MGSETPNRTAIRYLHALKDAIGTRELVGRITVPSRSAPVLTVVNADAPTVMKEEITCASRDDGWWLYWSWNEAICRADDLDDAVAAVRRVLGGAP